MVKYIREDFNNHDARIIIRTGQPGQAPEESIIKDYYINGYVAKPENDRTKTVCLPHHFTSILPGYTKFNHK